MATKGSLVGNQSLQPKRPVRYVATKKTVKSGKRKKKKPEWDSTVNDLNVHKATKEEQIRRHELHKSKNAGRMHLGRQQDQTTDLINQTPDTTERRKLAIVQEVLYGHDKLQDVLSESDRAMSVVKDLFGDDPKTFMGFPNITAAPSLNGKENRYVVGPVPELPETPTHLSLLSDSVMRTPALNEMSDGDKADQSPGTPSDLATKHSSSSFQPRLDLQRFQQFVAQEQGKDVENQSQHPTNERGSYFLSHQVPGKDHILAARGRGHESMALCGGDPVSLHGRGIDHVAQHGDIYEEPTNPQDNPSVDTTAPFVRLQAAGTLPGETKAIISEPKAYPVRRLEQVAAANHIVSQANHASESSSFLSQKSTEIVAGGPGFMVPVTSEEKTGASAVLLTAMPSSRTVTTDQQGSNKTKNIKATVKPKLNSSSSGLRSLEDLKKMVQELENEIAEYEIASGRQQSKPSAAVPQSFSGYTASLITAVTKLMNYLKESEIQRKAELIMREEVLQGFEEQRVLVDALTNDLLHTQEQNRALQHDLDQYKKNTDEQLHYLKRELFAVLRSHEYNALSSSINNLYSLNAVNLENGVFNDLRQDHHDLEYLPGGAALQAEHVASKNGRERDSTTAASFIPLATCSGQGIHLQPSMQTTDAASHAQVTQATAAPVYSYGDKTAMPNDVSHLRTTLQQGAQAYTRSIDHSHPMMHDIGIGANSTDNGVQSFDGTHPKLSSNLHNISADPNGNVQMGSNIVVYPPFQGPYTAQGENKTASQLSKDGNSAGVSSSAPVCTQQAGSRDEYSAPTTSVSSQLSNEERSQAGALSQPSLSTLVTEKQPKLPTGRNWITSTDLSLTDKSSLQSSTAGLLVGRSELFPCNVTAGHPITYTTPATYNPQHHIPGQLVGSSHFQSRDQPYWPALEPLKPTSSVSQDIQTATQSRLTNISWITPPGASVQASQLVTQKVSSNALQQRQPQLSGIPGPASNSGRFVPVSNTKTSRLPPGHLVRERLQKLANRQRTFAANPSDKNVGSASVLTQNKENNNGVQQLRPTSPHVHFKDPPVTGDKKQSPPVSPIPFRNTTITSSRAPPDKRVVVNLPNAWSDISSTFSV